MRSSIVSIAAAFILFMSAGANAQGLEKWGTGGGWDILIDNSLGSGCLIQAEYNDGSVVRFGIDKTRGGGYVTAFNSAWGDIEDGASYPIEFDLDGQRYEGEATGIYLNGVPGADINFDNEDFFLDIANKRAMTLYNTEGMVMEISLEGTQVGLGGVLECQEEVDG